MYSKIIVAGAILVSTTFFANANEQSSCPVYDFPDLYDFRTIEAVIDCGLDINEISEQSGYSALGLAIMDNRIDSVKTLLAAPGINVNAKDIRGDSPLIIAMSFKKLKIFRILINDRRINLNLTDEVGRSALHDAVINNHHPSLLKINTEIMRKLVSDPRVDLNLKDSYDRTALEYATRIDDLEIARKFILNSRGRLSAETIRNVTLSAERNDNQELIDLLTSL